MRKLHQSERGIASLIITLVLMIVISLIVLGFAQVARREQRGSLDRQLSTQAFYAAESGVNDVKSLLSTVSPTAIQTKSTCQKSATPSIYNSLYPNKYIIDSAHQVSYPCVLVSPFVSQLVDQNLTPGKDWVMPIAPVTGTGTPSSISNLTVTWTPPNGVSPSTNNCAITNPVATKRSCAYGVMRLEIVPTDTLDRNSLNDNDMVTFFYPVPNGGGTGTVAFNPGTSTAGADCTSGNVCSATIGGLTAGSYYIRTQMVYAGSANITVTGRNTSGPINFSGAQVQIDSTGKAQDVLRRIRVSYALNAGNDYPQNALQSTDSICKRFAVAPGLFNGGNLDPTNPYCGSAPAPFPSPPPATVPSGANDADVTNFSCSNTPGCIVSKPQNTWNFTLTLINNSNNNPANVQSCDWFWDDGTKDGGGPATSTSSACQKGETIFHIANGGPKSYSTKPPLALCRTYNIKLTIHFFSGPDATKNYPTYLPWGNKCP